MDSEETRGNGTEDETTLPGDLGELGGERDSDTRAGLTKGEEKKRKLGRPDTETIDKDPVTDNTQILNTDEPNVQLDLVATVETTGEPTESNQFSPSERVNE